jgi:glutamate-1-semialdehyde 2,1-aminomutase
MNNIAPAGPIYQAGTLSGNPLAMTAGLVTLKRLRDTRIYDNLETAGERLCRGLSQEANEAGIETVTNRVGSMWTSFFTALSVTDWNSANRSNREMFGKFFHGMLEEGVYLAPSQFEAGFISIAHTETIIDRTIEAARNVFRRLR